MDELQYRVSELERMLANLLSVGTVGEVDCNAALARVQIGDITTAPLPWLTRRAMNDRTWHGPEAGEQVVVLAPSGDLGQGIILPALYQNAAPAPATDVNVDRTVYGDGSIVEHDRSTSIYSLSIPAGGTFRVRVGGSLLEITDDGWSVTTPDVDWTVGS